jgi:hypothetical protein
VAAVSFIITKRIIGIREGTLISMIGIGKCLGFLPNALFVELKTIRGYST